MLFNQSIRKSRGGNAAPSYDSDALAYINAAGITDVLMKGAVNQVVLDLKNYNLWAKMKAVYPFLGGTALSHKWNLKDPLNTDAAFRLVFTGGFTHDSNGVMGNGTTGYANTFLTPSVHLSINSASFGIYINNSVAASDTNYHGGRGSTRGLWIQPYTTANTFSARAHGSTDTSTSVMSTTKGARVISRENSTQMIFAFNNTSNTRSNASAGVCTTTLFLSAYSDDGTPNFYNSHRLAFAFIGDGLSTADSLQMLDTMNVFNTTLGRQY